MGQREGRFRVRFWGVRGSYPTSSHKTLEFGGHTSCVEVQVAGHRLIFDAGTGIIPLGKELLKSKQPKLSLNIFLSHTHQDHLIGFYFFEPLLREDTRLFILGPSGNGSSLRRTLQTAMNSELFPIGFRDLKAQKNIFSLNGGETVVLKASRNRPRVDRKNSLLINANDEVAIRVHKSHAHPRNGVLLYRVNYRGKSVVYATDVEEKKGGYADVIEFARGADLLIHDAQYLKSEYFARADSKRGWGHSTVEGAVEVAKKADVKRLVLFHHDPTHDDKAIRAIARQARKLFSPTLAAYEGMIVDLMRGKS